MDQFCQVTSWSHPDMVNGNCRREHDCYWSRSILRYIFSCKLLERNTTISFLCHTIGSCQPYLHLRDENFPVVVAWLFGIESTEYSHFQYSSSIFKVNHYLVTACASGLLYSYMILQQIYPNIVQTSSIESITPMVRRLPFLFVHSRHVHE